MKEEKYAKENNKKHENILSLKPIVREERTELKFLTSNNVSYANFLFFFLVVNIHRDIRQICISISL